MRLNFSPPHLKIKLYVGSQPLVWENLRMVVQAHYIQSTPQSSNASTFSIFMVPIQFDQLKKHQKDF